MGSPLFLVESHGFTFCVVLWFFFFIGTKLNLKNFQTNLDQINFNLHIYPQIVKITNWTENPEYILNNLSQRDKHQWRMQKQWQH
jgi:hypothetical protein